MIKKHPVYVKSKSHLEKDASHSEPAIPHSILKSNVKWTRIKS
jgi:hypothetical protein